MNPLQESTLWSIELKQGTSSKGWGFRKERT